MLFFYTHGNGVFQQDNCSSHKSRLATGWLDKHSSNFSVINWPPRSPDLNPIEHLWDVLEQDVKGPHTAPTNHSESWPALANICDKSTEGFPVICYTDGSKIDGSVGFAFVVFRSGVESENFQFRIRDECTVFVAELLCLNFAVKWITEQNSVISEYLICTDSLSSLDSLKCISSSNNIIVEIQKQLKSPRDKNISIDFAFVRGHTSGFGNE
ncbi:RNase H domain-containing protein [Trichonephila clavipes]|nr:RNase H domain-containing protein [Trichonephila clavipes]